MRITRRTGRTTVGLGLLLATALPGGGLIHAGAATPTALADSTPSWPAHARQIGHAASADKVTVTVFLRNRDEAGAEALAQAVSTPGTAQFHHFIKPAEFHQRFSPTDAQVSAVTHWLSDNGLAVGAKIPANHLMIKATGTVAQIERTFGVSLETFSYQGQVRRGHTTSVTVPSSLAGTVMAVAGLTTGDNLRHVAAPPPPAFVTGQPCSAYWREKVATDKPAAYGRKQPYAPCGYTPDQLQGAYGLTNLVNHGFDGNGDTIAIVDAFAAPTIADDAQTYFNNHNVAPFAPGQFTQDISRTSVNAPASDPCGPQGWYGEETLDVEASHSLAPGANILYVGAKDCQDTSITDAFNSIVDNAEANIISNSYGNTGEQLPPSLLQAENQSFVQAVLQGIGVYFSSGDSGDEVANTGVRTVDFPASDPWVTSVGGTSLAVGAKNNYIFETGWGTAKSSLSKDGKSWTPAPPGVFLYGAGGGTSQVFNQPYYQRGVVPTSISGYFGGKGRAVPDLALVGDPNTGMVIGETQTFPDGSVRYSEYRIGGTSLSCPLMAAIAAITDEVHGSPIGFANPSIYKNAGNPKVFRDIVDPSETKAVVRTNYANSVDASAGLSFSLRTFNQTQTLHTRRGYDDVTGVGTPLGVGYATTIGY